MLGLIVGSFLNVLVLRTGARPLLGRSHCMSCGKKIRWFDLIPLFSFILLAGRCRQCGSKISIQYPLVELLTAVLFSIIGFSSLPLVARLLGLPMAALLVAIAVYDLRHTIIPDSWVWAFSILALVSSLLTTNYLLFTILSGPAVALPLFALWLLSRGRWMGLGDAKLALGIGWLLGTAYGLIALLLAFVIGALVGLALVALSSPPWRKIALNFPSVISRKLSFGVTMKSEVPFGPFLVAACIFVWISMMYGISVPFLWQ